MTLESTIYLDESERERRLVLRLVIVWSVTAETISAQFHIECLSAQSEHFSR